MKLTIIGSGSIFFTRQCIKGMANSAVLRSSQVALVDTDPWKCEQIGRFCQKINRDHGGDLRISYTTDRRQALPGSDYVVLAFASGNYHYRETGTNLALNYGIRQVSGETAGPGMVFRVIREVPRVLEVARDIERLCPQAMVINYCNPTNIIGAALDRHTKLKTYAFCDGNYECLIPRLARVLGLSGRQEARQRLTFKCGGINHFTFVTALADRGRDIWNEFRTALERAAQAPDAGPLVKAEWEFYDVFDVFMSQDSHNVEYLRYFQGRGSLPQRDCVVSKWSLNNRIRWYRKVWAEILECNARDLCTRDLMKDSSTDMVAVVIESIEDDRNESFSVNIRNDGRIDNLPNDTIVELYGTFGRSGIHVPAFGPLPRGLLGLTQQIVDEQELALEAAMTGSFQAAVRAIAADPLVMSLSDAKDLARDFIALEEAHLDSTWNEYWLQKGNFSQW